jgi:hypothetical protein
MGILQIEARGIVGYGSVSSCIPPFTRLRLPLNGCSQGGSARIVLNFIVSTAYAALVPSNEVAYFLRDQPFRSRADRWLIE